MSGAGIEGPREAQALHEIFGLLTLEADQLVAALLGGPALVLLLWLAAIWGLAWALRHVILRRGLGTTTMRPVLRLGVHVLAALMTLSLVIRHLFGAAPLITSLLLVVTASGVGFGLGARARAWLSGLVFMLLGKLRVGDQMSVPGCEGVVVAVGLFRLTLRSQTGELRYLPIASLNDNPVAVASLEQAFPVEVALEPAHADARASVQHLRALAFLCPYRDTSSDAKVELDSAAGVVRVRFRAWSVDAASLAEDYLREGLRGRGVRPMGAAAPTPDTRTLRSGA